MASTSSPGRKKSKSSKGQSSSPKRAQASRSGAGPRTSPARSSGSGGGRSGSSGGSRSSGGGGRSGSSGATRPSGSSGRSSGASSRRSSGSARRSSGNGASSNPVEAVRGTLASGAQSVASGAQQTGHAIGGAASKAKGPALAGGAALAGMVGGMAIVAKGGRRKVLGVPIPGTRRPLVKIKTPRRNNVAKDVVKAAGTVGKAGGQMAELATEVRRAREQLDSGQRRSPLEVVLEGLTARRGRAG